MKLSDIMSYAQLSIYTQVALVLFLAVFLAVTIRLFAPSRQRELHEASLLPLADDPPFTTGGAATRPTES